MATAQVIIHGTVYERSVRYGMPGVSVRSTGGGGAVTDSTGQYAIKVNLKDSISFSWQGKPTMKFPVKDIPPNHIFDIGLHVDIAMLPTVEVKKNSYRLDSLEFREEYRKVFDYHTDYLSSGMGGVGINLDALLSMKKIKRMEHFRENLIKDEQERYVSHKFNSLLVKNITGLESPALDTFMVQYRPTYDMLLNFDSEYQYYQYIKESGAYFSEIWKLNHPDKN